MDPAAAPPFLRFESVARQFGDTTAVAGVSLAIDADAFVALVGASGSGKSTLLKTVNRLVEPDAGRVLIEGRDVAAIAPAALRRSIGYVFQGVGLFSHLRVAENIGMVPRLEGQRLTADRLAELLALVELDAGLATRYPDALSGGQRQRVGVARALAGNPGLLLMDEPFGALDPITRAGLGERVRALHDELGLTTIMVTHDMTEALLLADRVLVMDRGLVVADETPAALMRGAGGAVAQALVAVPRAQALRLSDRLAEATR
ncbi:ATP-binding cassette domain-containing protein [Erythrobacter arachoides]|uniref:ATP-binding cassette domain-containing protein n=1 Tax=Aurantiacibacter arachoides TaxID=1850444 RepID=A0A845A358_9SPHN|nr:ATP-binding cassette domain-containing protein [Aurantiacibacter arachoides]MXO92049.1 ATP-binding cassette domain-containing protein [Aurantiacibacter arachoides]GGD60154.1 ABC transporter ATP-binding protein [Aurantiacibacter arachoides]